MFKNASLFGASNKSSAVVLMLESIRTQHAVQIKHKAAQQLKKSVKNPQISTVK